MTFTRPILFAFSFLSALSVLVLAAPAWAITNGQTDDFQDGTLQGWSSPGADPSPPIIGLNAGPAGTGDFAMLITAAAFETIAFENSSQWSGNYLAAGISEILFDYENFGTTSFTLGATLSGPGGTVITLANQSIPALSGWSSGSIDLSPSNFIPLGGTIPGALANVTTIELNYISGGSYNAATTPIDFHIDNIRPVPEPASIVLALLAGLAAVTFGRRQR